MDALIAYFSRAGENYSNGGIKKLTKGNTEVVAEIIKETIPADLFKIETVNGYPDDYNECSKMAFNEYKLKLSPPLKRYLTSIDNYQTIYLGYPIWWGTYPMAVKTFLQHYDFSGKIIRPFCTHQETSIGESIADLNDLLPSAYIDSEPLEISGSYLQKDASKIKIWAQRKSNH